MITKVFFDENYDYNPETGAITRKTRPCNSVKVGEEAGWVITAKPWLKYRAIEIAGKQYLSHRLAYMAMTGAMPDMDLDHIDGNGLNNKWDNLRVATKSQNCKNQKLSANNTSGKSGVSWYGRDKKWLARVSLNGKRIRVGLFDSVEEAIEARSKVEREYGYHANHGRVI